MKRNGETRPSGIIVALVIVAFVIISGVFGTTSQGKETLEKIKPYFGFQQEEKSEEKPQTIGYDIGEDATYHFDEIKRNYFEKEGKIKLEDKEIEYTKTQNTFINFFYTRQLPATFNWDQNARSGVNGRTAYVKPRGFLIESFSRSAKGQALIKAYTASDQGQVPVYFTLDIDNVLKETTTATESEIIGYVDFKLFEEEDYFTFSTENQEHHISGEVLEHINRLDNEPFPVKREIFESDAKDLETITQENGIHQEIKINDDYLAKKISGEFNQITYRIYHRGSQTPITLEIHKTVSYNENDIIDGVEDPQIDEITSMISLHASVIKPQDSETINIGESEQEIINKVSAWRTEVFANPLEIEYNYRPDEITNEKRSDSYCAEFVRNRIVVDLSKPQTIC